MSDCIFCKIIEGQIPSTKVYEDDKLIAIRDINPQAKVHIIVITKTHYADVTEIAQNEPELFNHIMTTAVKIAENEGIKDSGFRLVNNKGVDGCQSVKHFHLHILGGELLSEHLGASNK